MNTEVYPFKVGDFECMAISDGTFTYEPPLIQPPATIVFANAPKGLLDQVLREHHIQPEQWVAFEDPFICVMVNTGRHKVMVDTGADGITPNTGRLLRNLQAVGIGTDDIDTVILTHGHEDHVGGNTDAEGKPAFPKARYVMWREEWTFWTSEQAEELYEDAELVAFIRKNLLPVQHQIDLIDHEAEIVPGIRAVAAPGHTPGHMAVSVSSNEEQLLCISDVFIHPIHVEHPEWHTAFDMAPEQLIETRRLLLNKAATEKALMLASHFPFPGLGHVVRKGTGWQWQPLRRLA
jgi:glyoxylase-like metal-dependent hydrolase (beta-lactamase superfamily II)